MGEVTNLIDKRPKWKNKNFKIFLSLVQIGFAPKL